MFPLSSTSHGFGDVVMHTARTAVNLCAWVEINHESSRFSHNQRNRGPYYSHRCVFSTLRAGIYDDHKLVLFDCVNYGIHDSSRTHVIKP